MQSNQRPYHHGNLRAALLSAAETALEAHGVAALSLRELSRAVGVSHASPRRHFSDKQALLDALALTGFQRLDAMLAQGAKGRARDLNARIVRVAQAYVEFVLQHPAMWALMFAAKHRAGAPPDLLAASDAAYSHLPAILRASESNRRTLCNFRIY